MRHSSPGHLQLLVQPIELSHGGLAVVVAVDPAVLEHLKLPRQLLDFGHGQDELPLLLLEQTVHLLDFLHWNEEEKKATIVEKESKNGPLPSKQLPSELPNKKERNFPDVS